MMDLARYTAELVDRLTMAFRSEDVEPACAVVSLLLRRDIADIRAAFCCHVHFFASAAAAHDWTSKHAGVDIVNVHDAFDVARERAQRLLQAARLRNTTGADHA